jgi:hypothetical protein
MIPRRIREDLKGEGVEWITLEEAQNRRYARRGTILLES